MLIKDLMCEKKNNCDLLCLMQSYKRISSYVCLHIYMFIFKIKRAKDLMMPGEKFIFLNIPLQL